MTNLPSKEEQLSPFATANGDAFGTIPAKEPLYVPEFKLSEAQWLGLDYKDAISAGMNKDSLIAMSMKDVPLMADPDNYTKDLAFDEKTKETTWNEYNLDQAIHPSFKKNMLSEAKSLKHFDNMLGYYYDESAKLRYLESKGGLTQFAIGTMAELTNAPAYIGAAVLMPQTAAILGSTAAARFLVSGTAGLAIEGLKDVVGETDKTLLDYSAAMILDGSLGAMFGKPRSIVTQESIRNGLFKTAGITAKVLERVKLAGSEEEKKEIIKEAYLFKMGNEAPKSIIETLTEKANTVNKNFVQNAWQATRQDLEYVTKNSSSNTFSSFSHGMFHDATLQNINPDQQDFATLRTLIEETMRGERQTKFNPLVKEFSRIKYDSNGTLGIKPSPEVESEFSVLLGEIQLTRDIDNVSIDEAISRALRRTNTAPTKELNDLLVKSAKNMEDLAKSYHAKLAEFGHSDFKKINGKSKVPVNETYMPYVYDRNIFAQLRNNGVTEKDFNSFFYESFRDSLLKKGVPDDKIDNNKLKALSTLFYKSVTNSNVNSKNTFDSFMDNIASDKKLDPETAELVSSLRERNLFAKEDEVGSVFGRTRSNLNYGYKKTIMNDKGQPIELSFSNFLNKDYISTMDNYARRMSGSTSMRKFRFTETPRIMSGEESRKLAMKNEEIQTLQKQIEELRAKIITKSEGDLLYNLAEQFVKTVDKRTKVGKSFTKAVEDRDFETMAKLIDEHGEDFLKKIPENQIKQLDEILTKVTNPDVMGIDSLEKSLAMKVKKESTRIADEARIGKARFLESNEDFASLENKILTELNKAVELGHITKKQANKDMVRFKTIVKDMMGIATAKDPDSMGNRVYRIAHSYNTGRLLGQTFFTMPAEAMNVAWDSGVRNMLDQIPSLKSLVRAYKSGKIDSEELQEIQDFLGVYDEFLSGSRMYEFEHDYSALTRNEVRAKQRRGTVDKIESFGENFAEFTIMTGGIKPLTAFFQTSHITGVFGKMRKAAGGRKVDNNYNKMINELGFSKNTEQAIYDQINKYASGNLMNFKNWDADVRNMFLVGIKRRTDTLVQMQRLGDKPAWVSEADYMFKDTVAGKFAMELKQFVMTAYVKQLGRALNRKDMYIVGLVATQAMALSLSYIAKQAYNLQGNQEKLNENLSPEKIVAGTLAMMPQGSVLPELLNFASTFTTGEALIGSTRHNSAITNSFSSLAVVDLANKIGQTIGLPATLAAKDDPEVKDLNPLFGLTGLSNHWATRPFVEAAKE